MRFRAPDRQAGQSMIEYALLTAAMALALLAPWIGGESVATHLARVLADRWRAFITLLAIG